jgi:EamA domain-containing membrane protein RarD
MLPAIVQRLTPGGVVPSRLPAEILTYGHSPTTAVAASARHAVYATQKTVKKVGAPAGLWPLILFVVVALLSYWYWSTRRHAKASSTDDQLTVFVAAPDSAPAPLLIHSSTA